MKQVDVAIIGAGKAGRFIAEKLRAQNKEVVLIALPGNPEDYFRNLVLAVAPAKAGAQSFSSGQNLDPGFRRDDVHSVQQVPKFLDPRTILLDGEEIQAKHFVIASGCAPRVPPEFQGRPFSTPLNVLISPESAAAFTVVGAGPIGVCTAAALAKRGAKVKLLFNREHLLMREDPDIAAAVQSWLEGLGVRLEFNTAPARDENVVLAAGLHPNTPGMDLAKAGVYVAPDGGVVVDEEMRTPNARIHAVGAVTGARFNLAFEDFQAELAAENMTAPFFNRRKLAPEAIPSIVPLDPPMARLGFTESEAKEERRGVLSTLCSFGDGRIKLVARKKTAELLGVHIFGPGADGIILYFDLLMRAGISLRDVAEAHHYPSPGPADLAREAIDAWLKAAGE